MNVKQLIELLQQYPADVAVLVYDAVPVRDGSGAIICYLPFRSKK